MKYLKENQKRIKILCLLMIFQGLIYFIAKLFQPYQIVLNNNFDDKIPFIPEFVHFYYIWYILLLLIPLIILKYSKKTFDNYIITSFIFIFIEFLFFTGFPTTLIRMPFEINSFSTWIVDIIYKSDTPVYNLFPSGHCAYAFLFIISSMDIKTKKTNKLVIIVTSILIILSTLFIKQHVIIDILGSLLIIPLYYFVKQKKINLERTKIYAKIFCQAKNR